ncbi:unnamed protein product [Fusarium venenatum]|uniref:Uncharacterized protein n=1 Tax=Fusarium venenatum TaxID=56646 RepID=A0A2L2T497_9HYPO|nr:unnamed protein product [Fusarium venenatum]
MREPYDIMGFGYEGLQWH